MLSIHSSRTIGTVTRGLLFVRFSHARTHACSMLLISHNIAYKYEKRYAPIPTKPIAYKVVLPVKHPRKYYLWNNF